MPLLPEYQAMLGTQALEAENAAAIAAAPSKTSSSSAPRPTMTLTQPTSSSTVMDRLRAQRSDLAFSRATGAPLPPTRLAPSVAGALTGPPPRR
eukprot:1207317-Karenia_brevis.AAC.1